MRIEHIAMYVNDLEKAKHINRTGFVHIAFSVGSAEKVHKDRKHPRTIFALFFVTIILGIFFCISMVKYYIFS